MKLLFFFSSRRRHTRYWRDWSSDVCSSDLGGLVDGQQEGRDPELVDEEVRDADRGRADRGDRVARVGRGGSARRGGQGRGGGADRLLLWMLTNPGLSARLSLCGLGTTLPAPFDLWIWIMAGWGKGLISGGAG